MSIHAPAPYSQSGSELVANVVGCHSTRNVMSLPQLKLARRHMTGLGCLERSGLCTQVIRYLGGGIKGSHSPRSCRISKSYARYRMRQGNRAGTDSVGNFRLRVTPKGERVRIDPDPDPTTHSPHPFTSFLLFLSWPPLPDFAPVSL